MCEWCACVLDLRNVAIAIYLRMLCELWLWETYSGLVCVCVLRSWFANYVFEILMHACLLCRLYAIRVSGGLICGLMFANFVWEYKRGRVADSRCADVILTSYGTANLSRISSEFCITGKSESDPMRIATKGVLIIGFPVLWQWLDSQRRFENKRPATGFV